MADCNPYVSYLRLEQPDFFLYIVGIHVDDGSAGTCRASFFRDGPAPLGMAVVVYANFVGVRVLGFLAELDFFALFVFIGLGPHDNSAGSWLILDDLTNSNSTDSAAPRFFQSFFAGRDGSCAFVRSG